MMPHCGEKEPKTSDVDCILVHFIREYINLIQMMSRSHSILILHAHVHVGITLVPSLPCYMLLKDPHTERLHRKATLLCEPHPFCCSQSQHA